ncbi:hypothetical protein EZ449_12780 [Pedobacter frigidisoli]|uniref:Uncharacterized protein n=1 Tax=Pedobacter frigidisoli TaxID=2530455 RepID=A0A4R0NZF2_9SPHI|nr:hypothetical protein [Pedobacter frigidisoli]TCD08276.1 hypothetical protein EZ449_12780 [Pedobacter frigidisoli]
MKNILLLISFFTIGSLAKSQTIALPDSIYSGEQGKMHVQGVVLDSTNRHFYFSFTDKLVKTDLQGKLIGSVTGFIGHLGDVALGPDGKIYGSLEYKNDAIGKGIKKKLKVETEGDDGFYVAIFDGSKILKVDMNAEKEDLLQTVYIKEAVDDYQAKVGIGQQQQHRFGCSGIDGITFAPSIGDSSDGKKFLYLAYGIYGDLNREDNDHQVILKYDVSNWKKYAQPLSQSEMHHNGPQKPIEKYFVKTGNTRYGIQNLAYDPFSGNLFAAVYKGSKPNFINYDLFVIDGKKKPNSAFINAGGQNLKVQMLSLVNDNTAAPQSEITGWSFPWGATGMLPLGDGQFYISHNKKGKNGLEQTTIHKYKWTGNKENPFVMIK